MRWTTRSGFALALISLLVLTGSNLTRSSALSEANRAYSRGELDVCLQHALSHLRWQPWSREAALLAARCFSRRDYAELAEPYFAGAGKLSQSDMQIRAYGLARSPHPERAIPVYKEILKLWPDNVTALRRLAAVLLAQNETSELLTLAERLCRIPSGEVIGLALQGIVYHNDKNPQQAVASFERVLELDPDLRAMPLPRRLFWSHLADDLVASGRIDDAARALNKALANAHDAELMNLLGRIYFLQGASADAKRCFEQAAEWDPNDYNPRLNLSLLALQRHDRQEAIKHLNQARILAPRDYSVLYSLASAYRQLGRTADADLLQETLKRLRDKADGPPAPSGPTAWPRYAL